jgi:hypothetical protein
MGEGIMGEVQRVGISFFGARAASSTKESRRAQMKREGDKIFPQSIVFYADDTRSGALGGM